MLAEGAASAIAVPGWCRASAVELAHLQSRMSSVLANQRALMLRHWALFATTSGLDYAGAGLE